ncbi:universal stress protein [Halopenitus persicus]|uniref:Nucleotide-binding universal stress protein, UspA family n=1 Tax=Halopenitus persicus TaxID=1048396 RepID=A0A1H3FW30_9EURY|nr:universal stress protein [Halopenitus persicus]QHS16807.1 universal stress protein [haloarchaeon 3A1-DGR]SDX95130.1 Nucleotide-binding universal stress protein, UspA family [Halopenitus persicus]
MKVLLGIGGSDDSLRALERTVDRAVAADDDLVVAVLENPDSDRTPEEVAEHVESVLADLEADIDVEVRLVEGDPGSRLIDIAESEGFDRIVLGGGQTSPMGKITLGSIAEFVLLNAKTTVTLVR